MSKLTFITYLPFLEKNRPRFLQWYELHSSKTLQYLGTQNNLNINKRQSSVTLVCIWKSGLMFNLSLPCCYTTSFFFLHHFTYLPFGLNGSVRYRLQVKEGFVAFHKRQASSSLLFRPNKKYSAGPKASPICRFLFELICPFDSNSLLSNDDEYPTPDTKCNRRR